MLVTVESWDEKDLPDKQTLSHTGLSRSNCRGFALSTSVWGGREWSGVEPSLV